MFSWYHLSLATLFCFVSSKKKKKNSRDMYIHYKYISNHLSFKIFVLYFMFIPLYEKKENEDNKNERINQKLIPFNIFSFNNMIFSNQV